MDSAGWVRWLREIDFQSRWRVVFVVQKQGQTAKGRIIDDGCGKKKGKNNWTNIRRERAS